MELRRTDAACVSAEGLFAAWGWCSLGEKTIGADVTNLVSELRNMAASTWAEKYEHDAVLEAAAHELERLQKFEAGFGPPGEPVSAHEPETQP
jgi:hypothetical protein